MVLLVILPLVPLAAIGWHWYHWQSENSERISVALVFLLVVNNEIGHRFQQLHYKNKLTQELLKPIALQYK